MGGRESDEKLSKYCDPRPQKNWFQTVLCTTTSLVSSYVQNVGGVSRSFQRNSQKCPFQAYPGCRQPYEDDQSGDEI